MTAAIENLEHALQRASATRPPVGGFPHFAEILRAAGVLQNIWSLPAGQSLFLTRLGPVVLQGAPLIAGFANVPVFDQAALVAALRKDWAGESTFPEFLEAAWRAGVVRYEVDFAARQVVYFGCGGESYQEAYPAVEVEAS